MKKETSNIPQTTIGVDLGDTIHYYCVLDQGGNRIKEATLPNSKTALTGLAKTYPGARIALEVGTHSPWISELLTEEGCEVFVANARKLRAIYDNERKCDKLDARMLAKIARFDPDLLSPVVHISQKAMSDRLVLTSRERLVEHRKSLIQSVRSSIKSLGHRITSCSSSAFPRRVRESLSDQIHLMRTIEPIVEAIEAMTKSIEALDAEIQRLGVEEYAVTQRLQQITGVGPITSLAFVLAVEDPRRIGKTRDIGAYLGIVPRRDQSGSSDKSLGISKTGNASLRRLLVQCAQYILGAHGPESDLRSFGLRLAARGGKAHKKKAIVAVARKLAVLLLSLWKSGENYHGLRQTTAPGSDELGQSPFSPGAR
jgi:transposase